jgi:hypothetical protein
MTDLLTELEARLAKMDEANARMHMTSVDAFDLRRAVEEIKRLRERDEQALAEATGDRALQESVSLRAERDAALKDMELARAKRDEIKVGAGAEYMLRERYRRRASRWRMLARKRREQVRELKHVATAWKQDYLESQGELAVVMHELTRAREELAETKKIAKAYEREHRTCDYNFDQSMDIISTLRTDRDRAIQEALDLDEQFKAVKDERDEANRELASARDELAKAYNESRREALQAEHCVRAWDEVNRLGRELDDLCKQRDARLVAVEAKRDQAMAEASKLREELDRTQWVNRAMDLSMAKAESYEMGFKAGRAKEALCHEGELERLREELAAARQRVADMQHWEGQYCRVTQQLDDIRTAWHRDMAKGREFLAERDRAVELLTSARAQSESHLQARLRAEAIKEAMWAGSLIVLGAVDLRTTTVALSAGTSHSHVARPSHDPR